MTLITPLCRAAMLAAALFTPSPTTQQQPNAPAPAVAVPFRKLVTAWRVEASTSWPGDSVQDMTQDERSVYYITGAEIVGIDKRTGVVAWRYPLIGPDKLKADDWRSAIDPSKMWRMNLGDGRIYACEVRSSEDMPLQNSVPSFRFVALNAVTGKELWSHHQPAPFATSPEIAGDLVVVGAEDGSVLEFNAAGGQEVWSVVVQNSWLRTGMQNIWMRGEIVVSGTVAIPMLGVQVACFDTKKHTTPWSPPNMNENAAHGWTVRQGVAYIQSSIGKGSIEAVDMESGHVVWRHESEGACLAAAGPVIATSTPGATKAYRAADGAWAWSLPDPAAEGMHETGAFALPESIAPPSLLVSDASQARLFRVLAARPPVEGQSPAVPKYARIDCLSEIDPPTGRELWRWQPPSGYRMERIVADAMALYVSDGNSIRALTDAPEAANGAVAPKPALDEPAAPFRALDPAVARALPGAGSPYLELIRNTYPVTGQQASDELGRARAIDPRQLFAHVAARAARDEDQIANRPVSMPDWDLPASLRILVNRRDPDATRVLSALCDRTADRKSTRLNSSH